MDVQPLSSLGIVISEGATIGHRRLLAARITGMVGLGAYNWWLSVPFVPGMMRSTDGFFSDISANGQPHALLLHRLDLTAGLLLLTALS